MFAFTNEERAVLSGERNAIVKDARGEEHLVGLTEEETERYMRCVRLRRSIVDPEALRQFFALHQKHEIVRKHLVSSCAAEQPSERRL